MSALNNLYRYLVPGGVLSPRELMEVTAASRKLGLNGLHFGSRQDILLPLDSPPPPDLLRLEPVTGAGPANIISGYVSAEVFPKTSWLTGATYLYILEQIGESRLEINLTDPRQRLVPLFTGHLNFIASEEEDYWFLYVQLPGWEEILPFPALVHSWDIGNLVLGANMGADAPRPPEGERSLDMADFVRAVNQDHQLNLRNLDRDLSVPFYPFPYYEGMNRLDAHHYWLGLYWRNNWYDLDFLDACCELALAQRIGKICITPWKSFIISGIPERGRLEWEKTLGRFGINARHSSLELNWHLPIGDPDALELKRYLVREFDQRDISTYGLTIGMGSNYAQPFTSILIERESGMRFVDGFAVRPTYTLRYARNFDPNTRHYVDYARGIDKSALTELILELTKLYFEQLDDRKDRVITARSQEPEQEEVADLAACPSCGTVYDPESGDPEAGVPAGTKVEDLPEDYACWTCGTELKSVLIPTPASAR